MARTANTETVENAASTKKSTLTAQVSFNFGSAVRQAAAAENTTISGYITNLVYSTLGVDLPDDERDEAKGTSDKITLSTNLDPDVKAQFDAYADDNDETTAGALKKILADAVGYDLSQEPKADRGAAMRDAAAKRKAASAKQSKTIDVLMNFLAQLDPEKAAQAREAIEALG